MKWLIAVTFDEVDDNDVEYYIVSAQTQCDALILALTRITPITANPTRVEIVSGFGTDMSDDEILMSIK